MPDRQCVPFPDAEILPPMLERHQCSVCGASAWTSDGPPVEWKRPPTGRRFGLEPNPLICTGCQQRWPREN